MKGVLERRIFALSRIYQSGIETPNPDVYHDTRIKFDAFLKFAMNS